MNRAEIFERPVDEHGFAVDILPRDHSPAPAVVGGAAMVAQDEILVGRDDAARHGHVVAIILRRRRIR